MTNKPQLKVFVYGTLKSGYQNHQRYCRGVVRVEKADLFGRLYDMGVGYPALELPPEAIIAEGTADHLADIQTQAEFAAKHESWRPIVRPGGGWGLVRGEVLTFNYPAAQFAGMDHLEGFRPGSRSLYQRVLTIARWNGATAPVWSYVMEDFGGARRILDGEWR